MLSILFFLYIVSCQSLVFKWASSGLYLHSTLLMRVVCAILSTIAFRVFIYAKIKYLHFGNFTYIHKLICQLCARLYSLWCLSIRKYIYIMSKIIILDVHQLYNNYWFIYAMIYKSSNYSNFNNSNNSFIALCVQDSFQQFRGNHNNNNTRRIIHHTRV